jgi:hypothetical protein
MNCHIFADIYRIYNPLVNAWTLAHNRAHEYRSVVGAAVRQAVDLPAAQVARGRHPRQGYGKPTGETRRELSFRRAHGRAKLWTGTFCENAVSGTAADLLREAVTRIETNPAYAFMPIRLHTHDEILIEVDEGRAEEAKTTLRRGMLTLPDWAAGLPLQSEESVCRYYTKSKAALQ